MKRDSLEIKLTKQRLYTNLLHECWSCHAVGLKPGTLETYLGDYGERDFLSPRYHVLELSAEGLCSVCEQNPPPEIAEPTSN